MTYENSPAYGSQLATQLRIRDCGSSGDWLTPVLPVGISACFGMLARRRIHARAPARAPGRADGSPDGASRVSLA